MVPFFPFQSHYFFVIARWREVSECSERSLYSVPCLARFQDGVVVGRVESCDSEYIISSLHAVS